MKQRLGSVTVEEIQVGTTNMNNPKSQTNRSPVEITHMEITLVLLDSFCRLTLFIYRFDWVNSKNNVSQ